MLEICCGHYRQYEGLSNVWGQMGCLLDLGHAVSYPAGLGTEPQPPTVLDF